MEDNKYKAIRTTTGFKDNLYNSNNRAFALCF